MATLLRRRKLGRGSCTGISSFSKEDIQVHLHVDERTPLVNDDVVFRWGCTANIKDGLIINKTKAIHKVNNKAEFRRELNQHGLCPATWFDVEDPLVSYPCIVRPATHAQGRNVHLCSNKEELIAAARVCGVGYYVSAYINKVAEYRVFVCQGRAVWVANKTPADPTAIAWNVAQGGQFDNVRWSAWPLRVVKMAIESTLLSGLDFGGVDVMVDANNSCYVLEINSAPSLTSPYRQECVAKVFDYMVREESYATIPLPNRLGGYTKFIHPALIGDE